MSSNVLSLKDVNMAPPATNNAGRDSDVAVAKSDVKSMEYHRQVLQNKMEQATTQKTYISPSDNIMSPCTAKLNAYRNKQVGKAQPKSLFAQASAKKFEGDNVFGAKDSPLGNQRAS